STSIRRSRTRTELLANLGENLGKQCLQCVLNDRRKVGVGGVGSCGGGDPEGVLAGISRTQESSPTDSLIQDDLILDEQKFYTDTHASPSCQKEIRSTMQILSVVRIKAYSRYGYDYFSEIVLQRADFQEHMIAEKYFKNLYPIDFEDLNLLLLQGHLDHLPGSDKWMLSTAVKL
nr:hypothetical protein [Tanacetum cinerariifolium]